MTFRVPSSGEEGASRRLDLPAATGVPDSPSAVPNPSSSLHPPPSSPGSDLIPDPGTSAAVDEHSGTGSTGGHLEAAETSPHELTLQEARQKLEGKKLILNDKVSRFKGLFNIIKAAVDIASDVSARDGRGRTYANIRLQAHPAVGLAVAALESFMEVSSI